MEDRSLRITLRSRVLISNSTQMKYSAAQVQTPFSNIELALSQSLDSIRHHSTYDKAQSLELKLQPKMLVVGVQKVPSEVTWHFLPDQFSRQSTLQDLMLLSDMFAHQPPAPSISRGRTATKEALLSLVTP